MNLAFDSGEYSFSLKNCETAKDVIDLFKSGEGNINHLFIRDDNNKTHFYLAEVNSTTGEITETISAFDINIPLKIVEAKIVIDDYHNLRLYLCTRPYDKFDKDDSNNK